MDNIVGSTSPSNEFRKIVSRKQLRKSKGGNKFNDSGIFIFHLFEFDLPFFF